LAFVQLPKYSSRPDDCTQGLATGRSWLKRQFGEPTALGILAAESLHPAMTGIVTQLPFI
jgi:hypothetical protein